MNDTGDRMTPRRWNGCLTAVACLAVVVLLLIAFVPMLRKQNQEALVRAEIAKIRADKAGRIYSLRPEIVESLLHDPDCKERISEVGIIGDFADVHDPRFHALEQFPNLKEIRLEYVGCVDDFLQGILGAKSLEELTFHRAGVSEKGMHNILAFPNLKRLSLDGRTPVACLDALKGNARIESFGLYEYDTSLDQIAFIKTLQNLRKLSLELTLVGGGVLDLHGLPKLEELHLGESLATDAALAGIEEMGNLTNLNLCGERLTDAGLVHLRNNHKLKRLNLMWQPVTDAGLAQLSHLTSLEFLGLCKTKITDAGLRHLEGLTSLQKLDLSFTHVTDQGIKDFQKALPHCKIERLD
jgi:internalin A